MSFYVAVERPGLSCLDAGLWPAPGLSAGRGVEQLTERLALGAASLPPPGHGRRRDRQPLGVDRGLPPLRELLTHDKEGSIKTITAYSTTANQFDVEMLAYLVAEKLTGDQRWGTYSLKVREDFGDHLDDALARIIQARRNTVYP